MLGSSIVYNVDKWPFVVNHILLETIINLTVLVAIAWTCLTWQQGVRDAGFRNQVFDRFAPVIRAALVAVYYFALLSKLNGDFFDLDVSCASTMFGDLVRRFPVVPDTEGIRTTALWATVGVEAALPLLLTFRRSRWLGITLGLSFHFVLGMIGHRTFSALAYAAYSLFCMTPLTQWFGHVLQGVRARRSPNQIRLSLGVCRVMFVVLAVFLVAPELAAGRWGSRPVWFYWIFWSLGTGFTYFVAIVWDWTRLRSPSRTVPVLSNGLVWLVVCLVVVNGLAPYIGLKTQTSFTMYSNLRTETANNHFFMPTLRPVSRMISSLSTIATFRSFNPMSIAISP